MSGSGPALVPGSVTACRVAVARVPCALVRGLMLGAHALYRCAVKPARLRKNGNRRTEFLFISRAASSSCAQGSKIGIRLLLPGRARLASSPAAGARRSQRSCSISASRSTSSGVNANESDSSAVSGTMWQPDRLELGGDVVGLRPVRLLQVQRQIIPRNGRCDCGRGRGAR